MNWIMENSTLVDHNKNTNIKPVTNIDLYNKGSEYNFEQHKDGDIILSFSNNLNGGQRPLKNVPIYALVRPQGEKIYITYIVVFPYNGEYNILNLIKVGNHPIDIEHLTVELNNNGTEILRVFFGFHGSRDGMWVSKNNLQYKDEKFICYIALNGHGLYPIQGINFRLGGLANDQMDKGYEWIPQVEIISYDPEIFDKETMGWIYYNGRLGGTIEKGNTTGITSLLDKGWIQNIDNPDESYYDKPNIMKISTYKYTTIIINIVFFILLYFIIFLLLKGITKLINRDICGFPVANHFIVLALAISLYFIIRIITIKVIDHFAPK
jgi:hypothetical protein